jgi:hypothetical protein
MPHVIKASLVAATVGLLAYYLYRRRLRNASASASTLAQNYLKAFAAHDASFQTIGMCGRFIRGVNEEQLSMLSDEPGKVLSWVCADGLLQSVLGKTPAAAMVEIGFGLDWIHARLSDGTRFRLVVFPATEETSTTMATWDNLFALVRTCYGENVAAKLAPHMPDLKCLSCKCIDPAARLRHVSNLPVAEKMAHPEYMTAERFCMLRQPSLYEARAFFYHAVGCNMIFRGDGYNAEGKPEYVTQNRKLNEIPGACWMDLHVTIEEIDELLARGRMSENVTGQLADAAQRDAAALTRSAAGTTTTNR